MLRIAIILLAMLAAAASARPAAPQTAAPQTAAPPAADARPRVPQSAPEIALSFAPVVKRAAPAVVNIYARTVTRARTPFQGDPFFEQFFRDFATPRPRITNSLGSGVILTADGIVVTNYHVVGRASDIRVVLKDRREFAARVLLADKEVDLAILKLEGARDLPFLELRDSDRVEVGELVLAIGNPFGVGQTVSSGIVSGLARTGTATRNARGYFIQTDAPINPGNSGGALVDVNGRLIGINTSILTRSGGSNGIGFAIPANLVAEFLAQARRGNDRFRRPWAGMAGQPVDADLAASLGLARPGGLLISDLHPASPFARAGFRVGDVITAVDGKEVNSPAEMLFRMMVAGIGRTAVVTRVRDGRSSDLRVEMRLAPDTPPAEERRLGDRTLLPGLTVARINPRIIARFGLPLSARGVLVVDPGPFGARAGLRRGDAILAVNGRPVERSRDVARALSRPLSRPPSRWLAFELLRDGRRLTLRLRL